MKCVTKKDLRTRRHMSLRKRVSGTSACPRMAVFVSNRHMYVQFIDDVAAKTMASASTRLAEVAGRLTIETAKKLGSSAAKAATGVGIKKVVFDRGGFRYHGRIKAMADAARDAGLQF